MIFFQRTHLLLLLLVFLLSACSGGGNDTNDANTGGVNKPGPMSVDTNSDGIAEGTLVDQDKDGVYEGMDTDNDGVADVTMDALLGARIDVDGDGSFTGGLDGMVVDINSDGAADGIDSTGNGSVDIALDQLDNARAGSLATYQVNVNLTGLSGGTLTLQNNGGDDLVLTANGASSFATSLNDGASYSISVSAQPASQSCVVSAGNGSIASADVLVSISCGAADTVAPVTGINTPAGTFASTQSITLNCGDVGGSGCAATYYTTDGSTPTTSSSVYTAAIDISTNTTLKYFSVDLAGNSESVLTQVYVIDTTAPTTNANFAGGTYAAGAKNITLSCGDVGGSGCATTYYTTDGSTPTSLSSVYSSAIAISADTTLKFFSIDNIGNSETVQTNVYLFLPASPVVSYSGGVKTTQLNWASIPNVTHYRAMINPDGVSGFTQVGSNLALDATTVDIAVPVHLTDWVNVRYMVEACNAHGCSASNEINGLQAMAAIGYLKASNTVALDNFGWSVSLSGDGNTLAVGAWSEDSGAIGLTCATSTTDTTPANGIPDCQEGSGASGSGAVFVFARDAGGVWSQQAYVKASNRGFLDEFGSSVALSDDGNTLAVGAPREESNVIGIGACATDTTDTTPANGIPDCQENNSTLGSGAAYVFTRAGTTWSQQSYIKASNPGADDEFGTSVALSGDGNTLAVRARFEDNIAVGLDCSADATDTTPANGIPDCQEDNSASAAGAVYVFTRSGSTWSQQLYAKASNTRASDDFGSAMALSDDGNTLAVGAWSEDSNVIGLACATDTTDTTPANGIPDCQEDDSYSGAGAVYVFLRTTGNWSQQAYIKSSNPGIGDTFGTSLALSDDGNTMAVGAKGEKSSVIGLACATDNTDTTPANGIPDCQENDNASAAGAVYVFTRASSTWSQQAYIKASNPEASDNFGNVVSLSGNGNVLAVGALKEDSSAIGLDCTADSADVSGTIGIPDCQEDIGATDSGAAYVFVRSGSTWSQQAYVKASNTGPSDRFAGDALALSDDGNTLAVAAYEEDSGIIGTACNGDSTDTTPANSIPDCQENDDIDGSGAVYLY